MNIDSFTDEQLLNLVNKTIVSKTDYSPSDFTGGYVSATTAYKNRVVKYKVALFFGYRSDGKTSKSQVVEIEEDLYFIWAKAIMVKTLSMQVNAVGSTINELNSMMQPLTEEEEKEIEKRVGRKDRTDTVRDTGRNLPTTSTLEPSTSDTFIPVADCKNFIELKYRLVYARANKIKFKYDEDYICVHTDGVPYNVRTQKVFTQTESDTFYKYLFANIIDVEKTVNEHFNNGGE